MKHLTLAAAALAFTGCVSNESQVRDAIKKDPSIVFQAIEDHPDEFVDTVNKAVRVAQEKQNERRVAEIKDSQERDLKNPRKPALDGNRRLSGSPTGKIILVEYADFQCPACGMAYEGLKKFKEIHKDDIQFYYKNMPLDFHPMAAPAAAYYEAIALHDQNQARKFYDYVFSNQHLIQSEGFLHKAVTVVGANPQQVEKDLKNEKVQKRIKEDVEEFNKFGFTGTPVLILNGMALEGAQRVEDLERALAMTEMKR